jgi:cell division protein FtsL
MANPRLSRAVKNLIKPERIAAIAKTGLQANKTSVFVSSSLSAAIRLSCSR